MSQDSVGDGPRGPSIGDINPAFLLMLSDARAQIEANPAEAYLRAIQLAAVGQQGQQSDNLGDRKAGSALRAKALEIIADLRAAGFTLAP